VAVVGETWLAFGPCHCQRLPALASPLCLDRI
jgi:hypothetical protein